jgi:hypothetical protein
MPDPLEVLPYELWSLCLSFAIDGQPNGPLPFMTISTHWQGNLINTPQLWAQIYVHGGEREEARVCTFLRRSKTYLLHVDIMTVAMTTESLRRIAAHLPRVRTILIRPRPLDIISALRMTEWKRVASSTFATLSNNLLPSDVEDSSCFGNSLHVAGRLCYRVILIQFVMKPRVVRTDEQDCSVSVDLSAERKRVKLWEEQLERCASDSWSK